MSPLKIYGETPTFQVTKDHIDQYGEKIQKKWEEVSCFSSAVESVLREAGVMPVDHKMDKTNFHPLVRHHKMKMNPDWEESGFGHEL